MIKIVLLLCLSIFFAACSVINPGYSSSKPKMGNLKIYSSTLSEVKREFGEPAISQMQFGKKLSYKYYYNTPEATVDQALMVKGDYRSGCKQCGEIVTTFKWNDNHDFDSMLLTGISATDEQMKSKMGDIYKLLGEHKFSDASQSLFILGEENYSPAQHMLGLMYINGDGMTKDYQKASYWFARAAGAEYPPALYDLGAMYKNGEGKEINLAAAEDLYMKAANLGHPLAMQELIKIYKALGDQKRVDFWTDKYKILEKK